MHGGPTLDAPREAMAQVLITAQDRGPVVAICSILSAVLAVLGALGRLYTKALAVREVAGDDYALFAAVVLAVAQSVLVVLAAQSGLGRRAGLSSPAERRWVAEAMFAADLVFVATLTLVKMSMARFVRAMVPIPVHQRVANVCCALLALWGVASMFGAAFGGGSRSDVLLEGAEVGVRALAFWYSFDLLNLLSDLFLVIWPCCVFLALKAPLNRRLFVVFLFSMRFITLVAIVVQMVYLHMSWTQRDRFFSSWPLAISTQAVQALSITTACIPCLRPVLVDANSGMMRVDDIGNWGRSKGLHVAHDLVAGPCQASLMARSTCCRSDSTEPVLDWSRSSINSSHESHSADDLARCDVSESSREKV